MPPERARSDVGALGGAYKACTGARREPDSGGERAPSHEYEYKTYCFFLRLFFSPKFNKSAKKSHTGQHPKVGAAKKSPHLGVRHENSFGKKRSRGGYKERTKMAYHNANPNPNQDGGCKRPGQEGRRKGQGSRQGSREPIREPVSMPKGSRYPIREPI